MKHFISSTIGLTVLASVSLVNPAWADASTDSFGSGVNLFSIDFVDIGNPGNANDTTGAPSSVGAVVNTFRMSTYEISRDMIIKANTAGNLGITLEDMTPYGGNGLNRPATGVSWSEAARFVNWLNTSSGSSPAYKFDLPTDHPGYSANDPPTLWASNEPGYNADNLFRNSNATYFLPSENEWYKAAYYDPNKLGGAGYYDFATGSDSIPTAVASGTTTGAAVYGQGPFAGPADITSAGGLSSYGTMGQGGNIWEWVETAYDGVNDVPGELCGLRGGSWENPKDSLISTDRGSGPPDDGVNTYGFRVAATNISAVPEPASMLSTAFLVTSGLLLRRRGKTAL